MVTSISKYRTKASRKPPASPAGAAKRRSAIDKTLDIDLFKALCDPTRARLLACLMKCRRACSVGEVAECCDVDFSVVARHLGLLARSGVLTAEKQGRTVWYRARCAELATRLRELATAIEDCCPADGECRPALESPCCDLGNDCDCTEDPVKGTTVNSTKEQKAKATTRAKPSRTAAKPKSKIQAKCRTKAG